MIIVEERHIIILSKIILGINYRLNKNLNLNDYLYKINITESLKVSGNEEFYALIGCLDILVKKF